MMEEMLELMKEATIWQTIIRSIVIIFCVNRLAHVIENKKLDIDSGNKIRVEDSRND